MIEALNLVGRGMVVGFTVSAPIGPIGVMCMRQTLVSGPRSGLAVGIGATAADGLYALIAAFGLSAIAPVLLPLQPLLRWVAVLVLGWLAWRALTARVSQESVSSPRYGTVIVSSFLLLATNPAALVVFGTVFAGLGLPARGGDPHAALAMVLGVVTGAQLWWWTLTGLTLMLRVRITPRVLGLVNRATAVLLIGFALLVIFGPTG